jgi:hypothetical protein
MSGGTEPDGVLGNMAQWVNHTRSDDGTSVQIKWRQDGRWQSETFTDVRLAGEFMAAVKMNGSTWPGGWR